MNSYVVTVKLATEAILLSADNEQEAKDKALAIMIEQYGQSVAYDASYELKGEGK